MNSPKVCCRYVDTLLARYLTNPKNDERANRYVLAKAKRLLEAQSKYMATRREGNRPQRYVIPTIPMSQLGSADDHIDPTR